MDKSWVKILQDELESPYFKELQAFIEEERKNHIIYPPKGKIFTAFKETPFNSVRAVILGQDPYFNPGEAHGLSFSVEKGASIPSSLRNIFKELKNDLDIDIPNHGHLLDWARVGVFLLNSMLTVRHKEPSSHKKSGWERFTNAVIKKVSDKEEPVVFILWGAYARSKKKFIANHHCIIESAHPSGLSAHRGFFGSQPFSRANKFLSDNGRQPIDWKIK